MLNFTFAEEILETTMRELVDPLEGISLPWWPRLTDMIGGLRPHEMTLVCAPTGAGKTQLLANISAQLAVQRVNHYVAPVETGNVDFLIRIFSALERRDFNLGEPIPKEIVAELRRKYTEILFEERIVISTHENRVDIQEMINTLKFLHQEEKSQVAILDNLNFFLNVVSSQNERAEMDSAIHEFIMLAKQIPLHIILVVHPRKTGGDGRVESEYDIKGSSVAVQESSNVCLFNRPKADDLECGRARMTDRELVFKKIRKRGMNVGKVIRLGYDGGRYLEEISRR